MCQLHDVRQSYGDGKRNTQIIFKKEFAQSLTIWNLTTLTKVLSMYMTSGNSLYQTTLANMYL